MAFCEQSFPTFQTEPAFGRVYAVYGGIFVVLSLLFAWKVENWQPDSFDLIGGGTAVIGVIIIMWGHQLF
jgi:small multidrug resistance family-3 protein